MRTRIRSISMVLGICAVIAAGLAGCSSDDEVRRVLMIPRVNSVAMDYMLTNEVGVMLSMLEEAEVEVVVALPDGEALEGDRMTLEADLALADVNVSDYDGFLLPCTGAGYERNDLTVEIVREAAAAGVPVAAQYGSVSMLGEAGALDGREYAAGESLPSWVVEDGTYNGYGVVADGNVITSGTCSYAAMQYGRPDGTPELTRLFIEALG